MNSTRIAKLPPTTMWVRDPDHHEAVEKRRGSEYFHVTYLYNKCIVEEWMYWAVHDKQEIRNQLELESETLRVDRLILE